MADAERASQPQHRMAPVNLTDYPSLVRIWQQCGRDTETLRTTFVWEALRRATQVRAYRTPTGQVIGFLITSGERLEVVCVAPAYQGQGVGAQMLHFAREQLGAREVQLDSLPPGLWDFLSTQGMRPATGARHLPLQQPRASQVSL